MLVTRRNRVCAGLSEDHLDQPWDMMTVELRESLPKFRVRQKSGFYFLNLKYFLYTQEPVCY
jgi:hypothetical protein